MTFEIKKATRKKLKLKIGLQGASGSGKTYSALRLAHGIETNWEKIFFIDTENDSATYYSDLGPFNHLSLSPPYSPERFIQAIDACIAAGASVVIVDSMSHEWEGKGGCLDLHQQEVESQKYGNSFTAWGKITPRHNAFVDHLRISPVHIIGCTRSKQDYVLDTNDKGKAVPKKVGLKGVQRDGLDYEFGLIFTIDMDHLAFSEKDRTGIYAGRPKRIITEDTGKELLAWANTGKEETYTGTEKQKAALFKYMQESYPKEDVNVMKEIHNHLKDNSIAFAAMEQAVSSYISERTI